MTVDNKPGNFQAAADLLRGRGLTLAVMESCSGGLLSDTITNVAGCGDCFIGSVVSYATDVKRMMGVEPNVLEAYGVISGETALAMAQAVTRKLGSQVGLGITGVAGPEPQDGVPVGVVFVAVFAEVASGDGEYVRRFDFGSRPLEDVKRMAVDGAIGALTHFLIAQHAASKTAP